MTDHKPPQSRKLVPQKVGALDKRRRPRGLTRAIRAAIDAIIFDRCSREESCKRASITERALYLALEKPEVAAYWNDQIVVLRAGERAHNIFALIDVRDGANQMARVQAARALESMADATPFNGGTAERDRPGVVIQIISNPAAQNAGVTIDVAPNREKGATSGSLIRGSTSTNT
jgi:hypothetical protein